MKKYIEKELFIIGNNDDIKNGMDLITENNLLRNKCNEF